MEFNIATNYQSKIKSITIKSAKYGSDTGTLTLYSGSTSLKTGITPGTDYTHTFTTATTVSSIKLSTSAKRAYISEIVLETDGGGGSSDPVDASLSVDPASVTVKVTKTATATITTNYNGTLSVSSANTSVATATINGKVITVSGVAEGSTTLSVTGAATSAYNAINKTIDVTVTANARPANEIFYESFDTNDGSGGNDDQWSGSIASNNIKQDNDGWVFENGSGANECAKFGAGSKLGTATTPALGQACNATLTFKAAAWNGNSESTTLKLSVIDGGSVSPATVTMTKGAWNDFEVTLTNLTASSKVKFEGNAVSNSRFFLDEVSIVKTSGSIPTVPAPTFSPTAGTYRGAQTITLTQNDASMIMYTTDGTDPSYENEVGESYDAPFQISSSCTVKAIAIDDEGNESEVVSAAYVIKKDPTNTLATAYTVAQAKAIIDDTEYDLATQVYVKGTVSEIVTAWSDQYNNITYNISDDGQTTGAQFQLYRCTTNGAAVGDDVVAYGTLSKHNETYEFAADNSIVKIEKLATLSIADITVANGEDITPVITTNIVGEYAIEYTSDNEEVVLAADDEMVTMGAGTATITAYVVADGYKDVQTTFNVTVTTAATLTSVTLSGELTNTSYTIGDAFDHTGLVATANYSDDTHVDVTETATWEVDPETFTTAGSVTVTVSASFGGQEDIQEYEVTVNKKTASITFAPATIDVEVGKDITLAPTTTPADAEISYTITEGAANVSLENGVVTGVAEGEATIRADYAGNDEYAPANTTVTINVIPADESITVTQTGFSATSGNINTDISYKAFQGDASTAPAINSNNLRLYQNGAYVTITGAAGVTISQVKITTGSTYASTTVGYCVDDEEAPTTGETVANNSDYTITNLNNQSVSIYCLGTDKNTRLDIAAIEVKYTKEDIELSSIALSGEYQTEFIQNQTFNHDGIVVTANFSNGQNENVTAKAEFTNPDMTTTGTKTITVSYTDAEVTKTAEYDITVTEEVVTAIALSGDYKTTFRVGDTFNHDNLVVKADYNSGRKNIDVTSEATVSTPDMSIAGKQTITVSYGGQEANYTIKVLSANTIFYESFDTNNGMAVTMVSGAVQLLLITSAQTMTVGPMLIAVVLTSVLSSVPAQVRVLLLLLHLDMKVQLS